MSQTILELPELARLPSVQIGDPSHGLSATAPNLTLERIPSRPSRESNRSDVNMSADDKDEISKSRTIAVIASVTAVTGLGALLAGLLTVEIPVIAHDLKMDSSLQLWPASVYALTCGCTLMLLGSMTDVIGARRMYLVGTMLQSAFTLGYGLSKSGIELIIFRALGGIAASFCLPSAVSIVTNSFAPGSRRNLAFASMGGGQPIGFSLGLTLGGVFAGTIGWRWSFHLATILNSILLVVAFWALPKDLDEKIIPWGRLLTDLDWVGTLLISSSLGLLSYVFAGLTGSIYSIRSASTIVLLTTAILLIPAYTFWAARQERLKRPVLIPNSLWRNVPFTTMCLTVFLVWGSFNATEQTTAFYLEYIREVSPLKSSLYFLPAPIAGVLANIFIGLCLPYLRPNWTVLVSCLLAGCSPLILAALAKVDGPTYWACVFPAMAINPIAPDMMYTIANLLITESFPERTQALAGGVFNTVSQIGKSVGLATTAMIAARVTSQYEAHKTNHHREALNAGYVAGWWYCTAIALITVILGGWGLRSVKRMGVKRD